MAENAANTPEVDEMGIPEFRFKDYKIEDYVVLLLFWALAIVVFSQFFSRYVLNAAIVWTEEMARYLLISVGFLGSVMATRKRAHIFVEFGYRFFPRKIGFVFSTLVDVIKIVFFGYCAYLSIKIFPIMMRQRMVTVSWPMAVLYTPVLVGFVLMTYRSIQVAWDHWKMKFIPIVNDPSNPLPMV
jgi:TRAP-type C4-dicarboxylate transport system permease small subunit